MGQVDQQNQTDLFVLCGYNKILKTPVIEIPPMGTINLHGGKLPEYRGAAPINWQIINGETRQDGNSRDMIFSFDQIIAYISKFITLRIGDLIFTGTPKGVGPVQTGDHFEAFVENKKLLEFDVK